MNTTKIDVSALFDKAKIMYEPDERPTPTNTLVISFSNTEYMDDISSVLGESLPYIIRLDNHLAAHSKDKDALIRIKQTLQSTMEFANTKLLQAPFSKGWHAKYENEKGLGIDSIQIAHDLSVDGLLEAYITDNNTHISSRAQYNAAKQEAAEKYCAITGETLVSSLVEFESKYFMGFSCAEHTRSTLVSVLKAIQSTFAESQIFFPSSNISSLFDAIFSRRAVHIGNDIEESICALRNSVQARGSLSALRRPTDYHCIETAKVNALAALYSCCDGFHYPSTSYDQESISEYICKLFPSGEHASLYSFASLLEPSSFNEHLALTKCSSAEYFCELLVDYYLDLMSYQHISNVRRDIAIWSDQEQAGCPYEGAVPLVVNAIPRLDIV